MADAKTKTDAIIDAKSIKSARRGRTSKVNDALTETLHQVGNGQAARLEGTYGSVEAKQRSRVGSEIRRHWVLAHGDGAMCKVQFPADGVPVVSAKSGS